MPDRPWKAGERRAAALFRGTRFRANAGDALGFETPCLVVCREAVWRELDGVTSGEEHGQG